MIREQRKAIEAAEKKLRRATKTLENLTKHREEEAGWVYPTDITDAEIKVRNCEKTIARLRSEQWV